MRTLKSWQALGSRKGGAIQVPMGPRSRSPLGHSNAGRAPSSGQLPHGHPRIRGPQSPHLPGRTCLLCEGPARACLKQLGFQPNVQWTWGQHLPGRVGSRETPAAGPGPAPLRSLQRRPGLDPWSPGPRDPGCCSLCSQGEDALLPQAQGAFHKQELAREHLQAQAAGGGKCLAEAPPHGGPG